MRTACLLATVILGTGLVAQADLAAPPNAAETPPGITLLLQKPIDLDVGKWRQKWSTKIPDVEEAPHDQHPWLKADGETLVGGKDGIQFRIRAANQPHPIAEWQIRHEPEDARDLLRSHRGVVEITFQGKPPVGEPRHAAYLALASIAAAFPRPLACVGFGIADHGTFDDAPPEMLGAFKDPLNAMQPESKLFLLAKRKGPLDTATLVAALTKEFDSPFTAGFDKANTVDGGERWATVKVGDVEVSIQWDDRHEVPKGVIEKFPSPAVRELLVQHKAVLSLRAIGPAVEAAELARSRALARVAAALWSDDILGLHWRHSRAIAPATKATRDALRTDHPATSTMANAAKPDLGR